MPGNDFSPDEESEGVARELASRTVEDIRRLGDTPREPYAPAISLEMHARELEIQVPMGDVAFVMEAFALQLGLAREFDERMPCVRIDDEGQGETVPLSFFLDWPLPGSIMPSGRYSPFSMEYLYEAYAEFCRSHAERERISIEPIDNVLERVQTGLGDFLAYRIAGFRAWVGWEQSMGGDSSGEVGRKPQGRGGKGGSGSGGPPPLPSWSPGGGGLGVELWCNTPGLTIEFSHAYFLHFLNFGAPSSPVMNTLLGGRYVFQGKGPMCPSGTPSSQVFRIPPDYKAVTTYF